MIGSKMFKKNLRFGWLDSKVAILNYSGPLTPLRNTVYTIK